MLNSNKCPYTAMEWNYRRQELIIGDEKGYLNLLNIYTEKPLICKKIANSKIQFLTIAPDRKVIICGYEECVMALKIKMTVKMKEIVAHRDSIINIIQINSKPSKLKSAVDPEISKIVSSGYDNIIILWSAKDMHSLSKMELEEKAEIRCMTLMKQSNLIVTGHEDGSIRLWSMEIFENVPLKWYYTNQRFQVKAYEQYRLIAGI